MNRLIVAGIVAFGCAFTAPAGATTDAGTPRKKNLSVSPVHLGATAELLVGGKLADLPLMLYGPGAEAGYRFRAPNGVVGTPYFAGHLMQGHTPASLRFTSAGYAGGFDFAIPRGALAVHLSAELGKTMSSLHLASRDRDYEVNQLSGQLLVGLSYRVSPWVALRAGIGWRAVGQVGGSVFVLGAAI